MQGRERNPYKALADALRSKEGVPYGSAKLELPNGEGSYVEFVRGKDLARYIRSNTDKMTGLVKAAGAGVLAG